MQKITIAAIIIQIKISGLLNASHDIPEPKQQVPATINMAINSFLKLILCFMFAFFIEFNSMPYSIVYS